MLKSFKLVVDSILLDTKDYSNFTVNDNDISQYNAKLLFITFINLSMIYDKQRITG